MKKIKLVILILTVFSLSLSLYGCANKYNSVPVRSVKYYRNHQKQMIAMNKKCERIYKRMQMTGMPGMTGRGFERYKIFSKSNLGKDCINASIASY